VEESGFKCLAAACLHSVLQSAADLPKPAPSLADICAALDCSSGAEQAEGMIKELKTALKDDLSSTSVSSVLFSAVKYRTEAIPQQQEIQVHHSLHCSPCRAAMLPPSSTASDNISHFIL
jgi:hypothetical protein